MEYLTIKNWAEFQHYKDRNPPWIKLHRTLLYDYEFSCLQDASKLHLILIWLLASQSDGKIPDDPKFIQRRLALTSPPNLKQLIELGFLVLEHNDSKVLADCKQVAMPETETETETEKTLLGKPNGYQHTALKVLEFLNVKTGRHYRPVKANLEMIIARIKEGATEVELRQVVAKKTREWAGDEKMNQYLRPATLFNRTKFAQYQGELLQQGDENGVS